MLAVRGLGDVMEIITHDGGELAGKLTALFKLAQEIRGPFLEQAIFVEKLIEDIIAQHFCPDEGRRDLFLSLVINGTDLTFSNKIAIFERLLRLCHGQLLEKYGDLVDEIHKIRKFRNRTAHAMLDSSEEFLRRGFDDRIQLIFQEDGRKKRQVITVTERNERLAACSKVVMALSDIQQLILGANV